MTPDAILFLHIDVDSYILTRRLKDPENFWPCSRPELMQRQEVTPAATAAAVNVSVIDQNNNKE